ncbi:MAG: PIN domain-containing protein [Treponema sp.]|nr:PIN domain-containing protein [Treponema sp.]
MSSLDANCILRWLLDDIPEQTEIVTVLFNSKENFTIADAALIEIIFMLEKIKKVNRESIEKAIMTVIEKENFLLNKELFIEILPIYVNHPKLSFVDCYLEVLAKKTNALPLLTFDQKLANQLKGSKLLS